MSSRKRMATWATSSLSNVTTWPFKRSNDRRFFDRLDGTKPVEALVQDIVLIPNHPIEDRVAGKFGHPRHGNRVLQIHPVALPFVHLDHMFVAFGIGALQHIHLVPPLNRDQVAIERRIVAANVNGEADVTQTK